MKKNAIKIEFALNDDIDALVTKYYQITDNAQARAKGILSALREVLGVYENALKQESYMLNSKKMVEKMADDFKAMGINVNPDEWQEYRDLLSALKDINLMKKQSSAIQKAISLLS